MNMDIMPLRSKVFPRLGSSMNRDFTGYQREMNDALDNFFGRATSNAPQIYDMNLYPVVDIKNKDDKYLLEAEFPGMKEEEVELDFHNNVLTIKGERKSETKKEDDGFTHTERYFGSFRRDIPFEDEVDPENVKAKLKNGILHIELKKRENGKKSHKRIKIKS